MEKIHFQSPFGNLILIAHDGNLVYCNWDSPDCHHKETLVIKHLKGSPIPSKESEILKGTMTQLQEYFRGERQEFSIPVKLIGTEFQKRVWEGLTKVTYGKTASYKELAIQMGNPGAIRAIAQACGANPIAVIFPCHRIIASNGTTGGYTGGLDKKIALLRLENCKNLRIQ